MNRSGLAKKLLALVRRRARAGERTRTELPEFNRLFRLYSQADDGGPVLTDDNEDRPAALIAPRAAADDPINAGVEQRIIQQAELRAKYANQPEYYALLQSFYTAFIAPLEQEIAIAETSEELQLTVLEVGSRRRRVPLVLADFDHQAARVALAEATQAFGSLGSLLFPDMFTLTDFMRDASSQDQDNY